MIVTKSTVAWIAACAVTLTALAATTSARRQRAAAPPAPPAPMDYEDFCKRPADEKRQVFDAITAENRAVLARTQIERWRDANQKRLTPPQLASLKDMLELMTPDLYRPESRTEAMVKGMRDLEQKQIALFTREDLLDMQLSGPCLARKDADAVARQTPNFSGRWVMVSPPDGAGEEQTVTQDATTLSTAHAAEGPDHHAVYKLDGTESRNVMGSHGSEIVTPSRASWSGPQLTITSATTYPDGRKADQKEVWSLDPQGRLVIDLTQTMTGRPTTTMRRVHAKKK